MKEDKMKRQWVKENKKGELHAHKNFQKQNILVIAIAEQLSTVRKKNAEYGEY